MSWLTDDWRLKLLALLLAVLMLGAVAFSQFPATIRTLSVPISYSVAPGIVILDPPVRTNVTFSGLADVITNLTPSNFQASVDANKAAPGTAVKLTVTASTPISGVSVQTPPPIVVTIDTRAVIPLTVSVIAHAATGYNLDPTKSFASCQGIVPCVVHFDGPQSWERGLRAFVVYPNAVNITDPSLSNVSIVLQTPSGPFDVNRQTEAPWTLDISTADIHIHATPGVNSSTVPLNMATPPAGPPAGYQITKIDVSPSTIIITGDPATLAKVQRIILPAPDLSQVTTTTQFTIPIPFPDGISALNGVQTAKVTYTIQKNPQVSSPSPTPS